MAVGDEGHEPAGCQHRDQGKDLPAAPRPGGKHQGRQGPTTYSNRSASVAVR